MRGKGFQRFGGFCREGITPACAGKSPGWGSGIYCDRDHPRVCGEKLRPSSALMVRTGSPPRVRGKVNRLALLLLCSGITPACAGKRMGKFSRLHQYKDHPRVCGEKHFLYLRRTTTEGSPPRVRGKALWKTAENRAVGITPACAGKSTVSKSGTRWKWDHPRVCGEKNCLQLRITEALGSPPRVRGKVTSLIPALPLHGITPACAGKSIVEFGNSAVSRDHPRVCGEKVYYNGGFAVFQGSPPRVRGKDASGADATPWIRITPACAGKRGSSTQP